MSKQIVDSSVGSQQTGLLVLKSWPSYTYDPWKEQKGHPLIRGQREPLSLFAVPKVPRAMALLRRRGTLRSRRLRKTRSRDTLLPIYSDLCQTHASPQPWQLAKTTRLINSASALFMCHQILTFINPLPLAICPGVSNQNKSTNKKWQADATPGMP